MDFIKLQRENVYNIQWNDQLINKYYEGIVKELVVLFFSRYFSPLRFRAPFMLHYGDVIIRWTENPAPSPRIKHLILYANQLEDSQIENINCCEHLEYLDVSYNFFLDDNFLSALSCCSKLKIMDITCCNGISEAFIILCHCKELEALTLDGYNFLGYYFSFIPWLFPHLK